MPLNPFQELLSSISHQKHVNVSRFCLHFSAVTPHHLQWLVLAPMKKRPTPTPPRSFHHHGKKTSEIENFKESMESHPKNPIRNFGESPLKISKKMGWFDDLMILWCFPPWSPGIAENCPHFPVHLDEQRCTKNGLWIQALRSCL